MTTHSGWKTAASLTRDTPTVTGRRVREYRLQQNLSQSELARRAGVNHSVISRTESGDREPTPHTLEIIVTALGLTDRQALYLFLDTYVPARLHRHLED